MKKHILILFMGILLFTPINTNGQTSKLDSLRKDFDIKLKRFKQLHDGNYTKTDSLYQVLRKQFIDAFNSVHNAEADSARNAELKQAISTYQKNERYIGALITTYLRSGINIITDNEYIYVDVDSTFKINPSTGETIWKCKQGGMSLLQNSTDNHIYKKSFGDELFAINKKDGSLSWQLDSCELIDAINYVNPDYPLVKRNNQVFRFSNKSGKLEEYYIPHEYYEVSIFDGNIITTNSDTIYCLDNANGDIKWKIERIKDIHRVYTNNHINRMLTEGDTMRMHTLSKGKLLKTCLNLDPEGGIILQITPNGYVKIKNKICWITNMKHLKKSWNYSEKNIKIPYDESVYYKNNKLYLCTKRGIIKAFDIKNGKLLWEFDSCSSISSNLVEKNGVLYFANSTGLIVAIDTNLKDGVKKWTNNTNETIEKLYQYK